MSAVSFYYLKNPSIKDTYRACGLILNNNVTNPELKVDLLLDTATTDSINYLHIVECARRNMVKNFYYKDLWKIIESSVHYNNGNIGIDAV